MLFKLKLLSKRIFNRKLIGKNMEEANLQLLTKIEDLQDRLYLYFPDLLENSKDRKILSNLIKLIFDDLAPMCCKLSTKNNKEE